MSQLKSQIQEMLELQDSINSKINPKWREARNPWYRAIWVECAEALDHAGWKWWKHQEPNIDQIQLELVDIWHFGLSYLLETQSVDVDQIVEKFETGTKATQAHEINHNQLLASLEDLALQSLQTKSFAIDSFIKCCAAAKLSPNVIYKKYVGKNTLNIFRQDNGYKDGSYVKIWSGQEDNEWLVMFESEYSSSDGSLYEFVYKKLDQKYKNLFGIKS